MAGAALRILIADDHELLRVELRRELESEPGFQVVAEAGDGFEAVESALRERPNVCLLDVQMPAGGGIDAAAAITARLPETKVVILTSSRDDGTALAAARAGAVGYALKDVDLHVLAELLRDVADGGLRFPRASLALLTAQLRERAGAADEQPGLRECVLDLIEAGVPVREAGERLGLSQALVERQLAALAGELRALPGC